LIGTLGGLGAGIAVSAMTASVLSVSTPAGLNTANQYQTLMWLVLPIWIAFSALACVWRSVRRAVLCMGLINLILYAGVLVCQRLCQPA